MEFSVDFLKVTAEWATAIERIRLSLIELLVRLDAAF